MQYSILMYLSFFDTGVISIDAVVLGELKVSGETAGVNLKH